MGLVPLTSTACPDTIECPRIFMTSKGTGVVQGTRVIGDPLAVEIPATLLPEAVHTLSIGDGLPSPAPHTINGSEVRPTERGTLVVRGGPIDADGLAAMNIPDHETAVEVPISVLEEANRAYRPAAR